MVFEKAQKYIKPDEKYYPIYTYPQYSLSNSKEIQPDLPRELTIIEIENIIQNNNFYVDMKTGIFAGSTVRLIPLYDGNTSFCNEIFSLHGYVPTLFGFRLGRRLDGFSVILEYKTEQSYCLIL